MNAFEQLDREQIRLEELATRAEDLARQEKDLSQQIAEAHATGVGDLDELSRRRRALREKLTDAREALPLLHTRLAEMREKAGRSAAEKRMTGIVRASGSLAVEYQGDAKRLREAAEKYAEAAERLTARFGALTMLRAESDALHDRFSIPKPSLPTVVAPLFAAQDMLRVIGNVAFPDHLHVRLRTEEDEHRIRTRRTYEEVEGTDAGHIIQQAGGPRPWPALTQTQQEMVDGRARQEAHVAETLDRFGAAAARVRERRAL